MVMKWWEYSLDRGPIPNEQEEDMSEISNKRAERHLEVPSRVALPLIMGLGRSGCLGGASTAFSVF